MRKNNFYLEKMSKLLPDSNFKIVFAIKELNIESNDNFDYYLYISKEFFKNDVDCKIFIGNSQISTKVITN